MAELGVLRHSALELMKPLCMTMMQERSEENAKAILKSLPKVHPDVAREIQVFILFPIKTVLGMKNM